MTLEEGEIFVQKEDEIIKEEESILVPQEDECIPKKKLKWNHGTWMYEAFKEHLCKNRIEPTLAHFFIIDSEWTIPKLLLQNQDTEDYEGPQTCDSTIACTFCAFKVTGADVRIKISEHCQTKCRKKTFRCTCKSEFCCLDLVRKHIAKEHPKNRVLYRELPCNFCAFTCCFETSMERHCIKMHGNEVTRLEKCDTCEEIFYCEDLKLQHIVFRCNKGDSSLEIPFKQIFGRDIQAPTEISCKLSGLDIHTTSTKVHDKIRYICDLCGKTYSAKESLVYHMKVLHLGLHIFTCQHCGMVFQRYGAYNYHLRAKHSTKPFPYACDLCDKRFIRKRPLVIHRASHSGKNLSRTR